MPTHADIHGNRPKWTYSDPERYGYDSPEPDRKSDQPNPCTEGCGNPGVNGGRCIECRGESMK